MRRLTLAGLVALAGCGDDTTTPGTGTDSDTMPPTTSMGTMSTSTSGPGTDSSTTTPPDTTTGEATDAESTSSSSGTPNTDPELTDDYYLTNTMEASLVVADDEGVLVNDTDPEDDPLSIDSYDMATDQGGTVDMADDGSFTYTPPADFFGEDRFTYTATDGAGGMGTATVRVMVAPTLESLDLVTSGVGGFPIEAVAAGDHLGTSVRGIGDVNGDGLYDVVLGANEAASDVGAAYVVFGKDDTGPVDLGALGGDGFAIDGEGAFEGTGYSVAVVGDVNGDGLADIAVGTGANPVAQADGRAYVVFGKADITTVDLADVAGGTGGFLIEDPGNTPDELGYAVGGAGDINGDGLMDVIVGAPASRPGGLANAGAAYVVFGKDDGTAVDVASLGSGGFAIESSTAGARLGESVSGAGDVDGDGLDDAIVGATEFQSLAGLAAVVWGKTSDTDTVTEALLGAGTGGFLITGSASPDQLGRFVGGAGDVNGDGLADVIAGAFSTSIDDGTGQGRAYVAFGKADSNEVDVTDLASGTGGFAIDGEEDFDFAGWSVGGSGDINDDGFDDVIVGAYNFGASDGRAYALFGRGDDTTPIVLSDIAQGLGGFTLEGEELGARAGFAVGLAGDVNGDGYGDLVIGSRDFASDAGRGHVVWGGDYLGLIPVAGSQGDDVWEGTGSADLYVAGAGDDEIDGQGGPDILYAGPGDDVFLFSADDFARIDGGTGQDTVRFTGDGDALDLTNHSELAFRGIEVIDLGDMGDNQVFLDWRDLRAMSAESNTLTITGDDGDQAVLDLSGGSFADLGTGGGVTTYGNGILTVVISDAVADFVTL